MHEKKQLTENRLRSQVFLVSRIIEKNFNQPLKVSYLAKEVGLSVSHLHCVFQKYVGESIAQHINRLRSEYAASLLKYSSWVAVDISEVCGFRSAAQFSRCFKQFYGMSPRKFRKSEQTMPFLRGYMRSLPTKPLEQTAQPLPTVRIEQWPELKAVCLRHYGSVNQVYKPWRELLTWAKKHVADLHRARFLGLWFDAWNNIDQQHYRYESAVVLADTAHIDVPQPFFIRSIPAAKVAVSYVQGNLNTLDRAWYNFSNGWLPFSGFQPKLECAIDEYPSEFMLKHPLKQFIKVINGKIPLNMCLPIQNGPLVYQC